jgi:hypothetical protein
MFSHRQIEESFAANGFSLARRRPEFFFPMVLHRTMRLRAFSALLETCARCTGLTSLFGSPVIAEMRPS